MKTIVKWVLTASMIFSAHAAFAGAGRVMGEIYFMGSISYDHDGDGGSSTPEKDYAAVQIDPNSASFNDDADGDSNLWSTECAVGYVTPVYIDLSTDKGKAAYSSALSAKARVATVGIDYHEDATTGECIVDSFYQ